MVKKKNGSRPSQSAQRSSAHEGSAATLKDLLSEEVLGKLKAQASEIKAAEAARQEEANRIAEEKKKAEQKRLDNDFEHLLKNSTMEWKKFK